MFSRDRFRVQRASPSFDETLSSVAHLTSTYIELHLSITFKVTSSYGGWFIANKLRQWLFQCKCDWICNSKRETKREKQNLYSNVFTAEVHLNPRDSNPMNTPCFVNKHFSFQLEYCGPLFFPPKLYRMQVNELRTKCSQVKLPINKRREYFNTCECKNVRIWSFSSALKFICLNLNMRCIHFVSTCVMEWCMSCATCKWNICSNEIAKRLHEKHSRSHSRSINELLSTWSVRGMSLYIAIVGNKLE